jgi:hypothetical protein
VPRSLKVISLNFHFRDTTVVCEPGLQTARSLFDFDVVVIRPHSLSPFIQNPTMRIRGYDYLLPGDYDTLVELVRGRRAELGRLLQQGGVLVIILDSVEVYKFDSHGYGYTQRETVDTVTNYDFLQSFPGHCVFNGGGTNVSFRRQDDPFIRVLKDSDVAWTAYMARTESSPFSAIQVFAENGHGAFVGGKIRTAQGHVIILPSFARLDEDSFLQACGEYRFVGEATPPPDWAEKISVPGEKEIQTKIDSIKEEQRKLEDLLRSEVVRLDDTAKYKKLLFEKGKSHLEPVVRDSLDLLGFRTTPAEIIQGTNFEIDGRTTVGSSPGIIEVKGSKNQIPLDEFSVFPTKIMADLQRSNKLSKGIFVGNGQCTADPRARLGGGVFSAHVRDAAKTQSVVLLNSVELYCLVFNLLAGDSADPQKVQESILNTSGYIDLKAFCKKLPF